MNSSSLAPGLSKTEETVSHRRTTGVKVAGTLSARKNLCTSSASCSFNGCVEHSHKESAEKQLLKPEAKDCPVHYESPAPPLFQAASGIQHLPLLLLLLLQCCFTSTETIRNIWDGELRTSTSSFTQLLSSDNFPLLSSFIVLYVHKNHKAC